MNTLKFCAAFAILLTGCPETSDAPANARTTRAQVETLQQRIPAGRYQGKTPDGSDCAVYVRHGVSASVVDFTVDVSLDKENIVNGSTLPIEARGEKSIFYLNDVGGTETVDFDVSQFSADVESREVRGRASHLQAQVGPGGFAFVEVDEVLDGVSDLRRCEDVKKL